MARIEAKTVRRECVKCRRILATKLNFFGEGMTCIRCATKEAEARTLSPQEVIDRALALSRVAGQNEVLRFLKHDNEHFFSGYLEV